MNTFQNTNLTNFSRAFSTGMTALNMHMWPQNLMSDGTITYGSTMSGVLRPMVNIDGSRSTERNSYLFLTSSRGNLDAAGPIDIFSSEVKDFSHRSSQFLSHVDIVESIMTSSTNEIAADLNIPIETMRPIEMDDWRDLFNKIRQFSLSDIIAGRTDLRNDTISELAWGTADCAKMSASSSQGDHLRTARLSFVSGMLLAHLADPEATEKAISMFDLSAEHFFKLDEHAGAAAVVSEIPVTISERAATRRGKHLTRTADYWDKAASKLHEDMDYLGATTAIYRGLTAASISSNHRAITSLFLTNAKLLTDIFIRDDEPEFEESLARATKTFLTMIETSDTEYISPTASEDDIPMLLSQALLKFGQFEEVEVKLRITSESFQRLISRIAEEGQTK